MEKSILKLHIIVHNIDKRFDETECLHFSYVLSLFIRKTKFFQSPK